MDEGEAATHLAPEGVSDLVGGVLGRPLRRVRAPGEVVVLEDERRAGEMRWGANDFG